MQFVGREFDPPILHHMKRRMLADLPWADIQRQHDSGVSVRDLCKNNKIGINSIVKANAAGLLKTRSLSEALSLSLRNKPRDYSSTLLNKTALEKYRLECRFKFALSDFPEEFDFALIEQHGWYRAKNRGDNQQGVSRDHAVSVRFGFDNNIPASHIAHPANCVLMQHHLNASKGRKNLFSYDELLERIHRWNEKYFWA